MTDTEHTPSHPVMAAVYDSLSRRAEERLLPEHREYLATDLHGAVLDLGAGTGAMFPYFRSAIEDDPSLVLHAIEPDPHMRRRAVRKASELDLDIEIRPEGAQSLPYADDSFDVVVASLVFCTIPDVEAALDEVARVLEPDGEFRFLEHVRADGWPARVQDVVTPVWRLGVAGCHLNRDTTTTFTTDDRFEVTDLDELDITPLPVMPFVRGTLARRTDAAPRNDGSSAASRRRSRS